LVVLETIERQIQAYARRKAEIAKEMNAIRKAFQVEPGDAAGCLTLEEVYSTKNGKKYGPFGPYYYIYHHRGARKLEKSYVGKRADALIGRREALVKLRELDAEYREILKIERRLNSALEGRGHIGGSVVR
jgi:hypothetical protein